MPTLAGVGPVVAGPDPTGPTPFLLPGRAAAHRLAPLPALSRGRGGTYSATVGEVRFRDGSTARTDLIRLTPSVDAYSLDAQGISPRQLCHYREAADPASRSGAGRSDAGRTEARRVQLTRLLAATYPHVSLEELSRRVRGAGYPLGARSIRAHEAIAATQAAIWSLTNGLELDTRPLDEPVVLRSHIGGRVAGRIERRPTTDDLDWHTQLPAARTAYLELEFAGALELSWFELTVGTRTGRHPLVGWLESSVDRRTWHKVSGSTLRLSGNSLPEGPVRRRLGAAATVSSVDAAGTRLGHRHYRLGAQGPSECDGLLDLRGIRVGIAGASRFRNSDAVVYLYEYLRQGVLGLTTLLREVVDARVLIGSASPGGPSRFTPLVCLTDVGTVPSPTRHPAGREPSTTSAVPVSHWDQASTSPSPMTFQEN